MTIDTDARVSENGGDGVATVASHWHNKRKCFNYLCKFKYQEVFSYETIINEGGVCESWLSPS